VGRFSGVRAGAAVLAVAVMAPLAAAPSAWGGDTVSDGQQLPDLAPILASHFEVTTADNGFLLDPAVQDPADMSAPGAGQALRFHTAIRNVGDYSLEIVGVPGQPHADGSQAVQANQCVQWAGPTVHGVQRTCTQFVALGTMSWHAHHGHLHLDDFARYELRHLRPDGSVDDSAGGLAAGGEKVGFCVQDVVGRHRERTPVTWEHSTHVPGSDGLTPWYVGCGQPGWVPYVTSIRQGLSPGWLDIYFSSYPGQQILVDGLPDGRYALVTRINPNGLYRETGLGNNVSVAPVELYHDETGQRQARALD
jgi:hypothetical protein